ncbi:hypothetical protein SAMN04487965_0062 [Microbulbifer donghaiensis]|uniref:SmpA / OmlA family protein n=1 Tax=Microbulbifer donghaiensis TaxID=494016 RepID=A0A1M4U4Q2_9GAMM|nr:hypothetical protein [Microbulbifer donghaiensis]SHE51712.1 hypothetical protein SAMN04487965_0062 [Microbulbifer donghaiensis]
MFRRISKRATLAAGTVTLLLTVGVQAETIEIPVGAQGGDTHVEQVRGLKKDEVTARLGEPVSIQGPIGDPAISRWEYADFYVYFEWETVLHTVRKPQG